MTAKKKKCFMLGPAPLNAKRILFKAEDETAAEVTIGPAWFVLADGTKQNVRDVPRRKFNGKPLAQWFTRPDMVGYAKHVGLPLEEV
jgi:hypothetical protein